MNTLQTNCVYNLNTKAGALYSLQDIVVFRKIDKNGYYIFTPLGYSIKYSFGIKHIDDWELEYVRMADAEDLGEESDDLNENCCDGCGDDCVGDINL